MILREISAYFRRSLEIHKLLQTRLKISDFSTNIGMMLYDPGKQDSTMSKLVEKTENKKEFATAYEFQVMFLNQLKFHVKLLCSFPSNFDPDGRRLKLFT